MIPDSIGDRLYLDSNVFIYAFENTPLFEQTAQAIFQRVADGQAELFVSELIYAEIMPVPLRQGRHDLLERYADFLQNTDGVTVLPLTSAIVLRTVSLRAQHNLKTVDALHIATALEHDCTAFISNDQALKRVTDLPVFCLSQDF